MLAHETGGSYLVVDYKTDRLDGADPEALVARDYATQRLVYALAALRDGARARRGRLLLPRARRASPSVAVYGAADASALAERLLALADGVLRGRFTPTDTPHRELCADLPGAAHAVLVGEERTLAAAPG